MEEFTVDFRLNRQFNQLVAANFTIEGTGAAVLLGGLLLGNRSAVITGLVLVIAGAIALFLDLASPTRSWRSVLRPGKSWISRGTLCFGCLILFTMLLIIIPGEGRTLWGRLLATLSAAAAVMTMLYTGLLVSSMGAIPSWKTKLVPLLFFLHSSTSGCLILLLLLSVENSSLFPALLFPTTLLIMAAALLTLLYAAQMARRSGAARESALMLLHGNQKTLFFGGALGCGFLLPLAFIWMAYALSGPETAGNTALMAAGVAGRLAGDFSFRLALLRTGIYEPVIP